MKRRTLDILFSIGGLGLAGLLLIVGIVFTSNANFANDYVTDQLSQQNITFKPLDALTPEEKARPGLVKYAGQKLTTGKQAEVYANDFIGLHLESTAGGKTYAELGAVQTDLRTQLADAQRSGAANVADLQKQVNEVNAQRETVFKGETLRGLLLTSYGFSEFGTKAQQAANVAYGAAALLFLLGLAGLIHGFVTPKTRAFAAPESLEEKVPAAV